VWPLIDFTDDREGYLFTATVHRKPLGEKKLIGVTPKTSGKVSGKTSGEIIEFMRKNSLITIPELAEKIGVTERSVEQNIQKLQDRGIVRRVGPAKGGHWEVLFRL
jgi:ATP-dependent DNA helicase RecG